MSNTTKTPAAHQHDAHEHGLEHALSHEAATAPADSCCGASCGASVPLKEPQAALPASAGALQLRVPSMDCPTEEGQIRAALEGIATIRRLSFDLPGRALAVDAPPAAWLEIVGAINAAGFKTETLAAPVAPEEGVRAQRAELLRLVGALLVAMLAELINFLAPETTAWKAVGMGVAAGAIALAGTSVFRKGVSSLLRGQLNINALMSVAVAGAFVIGQWPEAAMVMALYSLAELIEARAVDRARNAISGLLALSPQEAEVLQGDGSWTTV